MTVLDEKIHRRIIADIERYAERAGIPPEAIATGLEHYCEAWEIEWVRGFLLSRRQPPCGFVYNRTDNAANRMIGITGCMVRNFLDARMMSVSEAIENRPTCALLLVVGIQSNSTAWKMSELADLLTARMTQGRATVTCVEDLEILKQTHPDLAKVLSKLGVRP